jgi:hypothetical protein
MRVRCYFNLHKKVWSIKAMEGPQKGRVVRHATTVLLADAKPVVSQKGRERVLREGRKNVHAYVEGLLSYAGDSRLALPEWSTEVTYNPYKYTTFVRKSDTKQWLGGSAWALLQDRSVAVVGGVYGTYDGLERMGMEAKMDGCGLV